MKRLKIARVALAGMLFVSMNLCFFGLAEGASVLFGCQLLPAVLALNGVAVVAVLLVTVLLGRVYCSTVCPMGVFQDIVMRIARMIRGKRPPRASALPAPPGGVRYVVLLASAVLIALGLVSLGALFDGYSLYGRIATQVFKPAYSAVHNLAAAVLCEAGRPYLIREEVFVRGACALAVALAGLVGIVALAWWRGRIFCNTLCPVGAALAVASRRPLVRLAIDKSACVGCGLCAAACKCGAIDLGGRRVDDASCVRCFNCLAACRKNAISIGLARSAKAPVRTDG